MNRKEKASMLVHECPVTDVWILKFVMCPTGKATNNFYGTHFSADVMVQWTEWRITEDLRNEFSVIHTYEDF